MFVFTSDKERLWKHFQKDPVLFAYHIGDLDDFFFPHCQWAASYSTRRHPIVRDVVLIYSGGQVPTVLAFGVEADYPELLAETIDVLPPKFYCHFKSDCRAVLESRLLVSPLGRHLKMQLGAHPERTPKQQNEVVVLESTDVDEVTSFYKRSYAENYFTARMLETGWYRGIRTAGRLVSVAGVHVVSDRYKIAVLGNIATDPDFRGRHLAQTVTRSLCSEMVGQDKTVCLNVKAANEAAIRCYQKIGFSIVHEYEEALCELRR